MQFCVITVSVVCFHLGCGKPCYHGTSEALCLFVLSKEFSSLLCVFPANRFASALGEKLLLFCLLVCLQVFFSIKKKRHSLSPLWIVTTSSFLSVATLCLVFVEMLLLRLHGAEGKEDYIWKHGYTWILLLSSSFFLMFLLFLRGKIWVLKVFPSTSALSRQFQINTFYLFLNLFIFYDFLWDGCITWSTHF